MANLATVKASGARFGAETRHQVAAIRAVAESMDRASAALQALVPDPSHPDVTEAVAQIEEIKKRLQEAARIADGVATEITDHVARL